ncbi:MAG: bacteriocin-protection protein, partial [Acidobacteria bacterium]
VSYMQRFTPRKPRSTWSAINIARAQELAAAGRMQPAGLAAFERRTEDRSRLYTHEQKRPIALSPDERREFEAHPQAWAFFAAQPSSYRRVCAWWLQSAKKDETRKRRLAQLIDVSARGQYPPPFIQRPKS